MTSAAGVAPALSKTAPVGGFFVLGHRAVVRSDVERLHAKEACAQGTLGRHQPLY